MKAQEPETVWPRSAQAAAAVLVLTALLLITYHAYLSGRWATKPSKIKTRPTQVADPGLERGEDDSDSEPEAQAPTRTRDSMGLPRPAQNVSTLSGPESRSQKVTAADEKIDINRASIQELQRLPGIGPQKAQLILDRRRVQVFRQVEELRQIKGIGPKTFEALKPLVRVGRPLDVEGTQ